MSPASGGASGSGLRGIELTTRPAQNRAGRFNNTPCLITLGRGAPRALASRLERKFSPEAVLRTGSSPGARSARQVPQDWARRELRRA
eukprot:6080975-Alexandrium_andersonii.AAC.1